jgi:hypothetical protein
MSRVDQQGIEHPTMDDPFDLVKDAPHIISCEECSELFPGVATIVANQADVSNQTNT